MGYTHYWSRSDMKGIKKALPVIKDIVKRYQNIIQFESSDQREPVVEENMIRFNGINEDGHETFLFNGKDNFCKTARKPYDIVVCECLIVLNHFLRDLKVGSDGMSGNVEDENVGKTVKNPDGMWKEALKNVSEHYNINYDPVCCNIRNQFYDWELI